LKPDYLDTEWFSNPCVLQIPALNLTHIARFLIDLVKDAYKYQLLFGKKHGGQVFEHQWLVFHTR
jgi:hypothetical protein